MSISTARVNTLLLTREQSGRAIHDHTLKGSRHMGKAYIVATTLDALCAKS